MKVKVTRKFRDKYTGELYKKGDVLEITEERYNEIMRVGDFVYKITQKDAEKPLGRSMIKNIDKAAETPTNEPEPPGDDFESMSVRELKEYADKAYKLTFKTGTKKAEIIDKLRRMEQASK